MYYHHNSNDAAQWRIRVNRRNNIYDQLSKLGKLPALMAGGLLLGLIGTTVPRLESFHSWKETLENSILYNSLNTIEKGKLKRLEYNLYSRLEELLCSLGRVLTLAVEDLDEQELLESLYELKLWSVRTTLYYKSTDEVSKYFKWIAKSAQAAFLGSQVPELPNIHPGRYQGKVVPFTGQLDFISKILLGERSRKQGLKLEEARSVAQVSALSRSLPYPSETQVSEDVERVIDLTIESAPKVPIGVLNEYRTGLARIKARCGDKVISTKTHMSLSTSGCFENSNSNGGRGRYITRMAKRPCNLLITKEIMLLIEGTVDVFGREIWPKHLTPLIDNMMLSDPNFKPKLGMYLYHAGDRVQEIKDRNKEQDQVPEALADIINNVMSYDLLRVGDYYVSETVKAPSIRFNGLLCFKKGITPFFKPGVKQLPVKADVSIEAGLKSRMTTSAMASYVHFGQQVGHLLRSYLRKDPFLQVGFEEPDKLWEVLKQYRYENQPNDSKVE